MDADGPLSFRLLLDEALRCSDTSVSGRNQQPPEIITSHTPKHTHDQPSIEHQTLGPGLRRDDGVG
jgi:hypothetical protein